MTSFDARSLLAPYESAYREQQSSVDVLPVCVELHTDSLTPVGAFERFVGSAPGFLLESVEEGQRYGRFSFLGRNPLGSLTLWPDRNDGSGLLREAKGDAFTITASYLKSLRVGTPVGASTAQLPFSSGMVGVFGWDCVRAVETLPPRRSSTTVQPDAVLMAVGELVAFDHWRQTVTLIVNAPSATPFDDVIARVQSMLDDLRRPTAEYLRPHRDRSALPVAQATTTVSSEAYRQMVLEAKEQIAAGEIFQVVLSRRYDVGPVEDPFEVYRVLRQVNPSAYLYYLQSDAATIVGSSPEALVRVRDGVVTTRPIAGSRPRGSNELENAHRAASLREDPKEIAEHVMLVDLGRNDLGRVSKYGTVTVDELMTVETYSHIMHLTSEVSGTLRDDVDPLDVLRATFPAGTLSGAPKVRAMEIITDMEPQARGLYGGAIGYFDVSGNFDAAILIRTLVVDQRGEGSVQTGAGIVWDSDPASEDQECDAKAEAILRSVGGARGA